MAQAGVNAVSGFTSCIFKAAPVTETTKKGRFVLWQGVAGATGRTKKGVSRPDLRQCVKVF